jgi:hypothetical protein
MKKSFLKALRLLVFKISRKEMLCFNYSDLIFGLLCTWVVGVGRYWDSPDANLLQHLGLGSIAYVFALSTLLWIIILPLRAKDASYFRILCFVSMTSPPAIFYAIPVERFFSMDTSAMLNAYFLLAVATWRMLLLMFFMNRLVALSVPTTIAVSLLPVTLIIALLSARGSQHVVFELMGGIRGATGIFDVTVYWISQLSILALFPVVLIYAGLVVQRTLLRHRPQWFPPYHESPPPPPLLRK